MNDSRPSAGPPDHGSADEGLRPDSQRPDSQPAADSPDAVTPDGATLEHRPAAGKSDDATPTKSRVPTGAASTEDFVGGDIVQGFDLPETLGKYQIRDELGSGNFGKVVRAYDPSLDRLVAIKIPLPRKNRADVERFETEAKRLAKLTHKGIVKVIEIDRRDGLFYIVTEYLKGPSLRGWLERNRWPWQRAVEVAIDIADALAHAHSNDIIHRDLKPENIILVDDVHPVLVDFGLSLSHDDDPSNERHWIKGTPQYMSPEQHQGQGHRVDGRTDIFSLGIILYEMLCGTRPFRGPTLNDLKRQICQEEQQPIRQKVLGAPPELEKIAKKALAKDYRDRYSTAGDLVDDLRAVLADTATRFAQVSRNPAPHGGSLSQSGYFGSGTIGRQLKESERRQVTVVLARLELDGDPANLAQLDIEQQDDLHQIGQRVCHEVVVSLEGTAIPKTGDTFLACFGFPTAMEDAPRRAVRAGLEIQRQVADLNAAWKTKWGVKLDVRVAIHTDLAVVGDNVSGGSVTSISLTGPAVAISERIQTATENGDIATEDGDVLITVKTRDLLKREFRCESLGLRTLPRMPEPVELFRVSGECPVPDDLDALSDVHVGPMVGREAEFGMLRNEWIRVVEGAGRVVQLTGEAGLGKSRLTSALRDYVRTNTAGCPPQVVTWRGSAQFQNTGFYAVNDWFQQRLHYERGEPAAQRLERLETYLRDQQLGRPQDVVPLFAALLSIPCEDRYPPLDLSPTGKRQKTLDLLVNWLLGLTADGPLLFIVEDLHWVDPSTLELLDLLVRQMSSDPILTVLTFRSEFTTPWNAPSFQSTIPLTRLGKVHVTEMIRHQTGCRDIPGEVVDQLHERTNGVPLFVEEYTRMLLDGGRVKIAQGRLELTDAAALQTIPNTLKDLLTARLDRLTCDPIVIQLAAAMGREFGYDLLRSVCDLDEAQLNGELEKLVAGEILGRRGRGARCTYHFKHNLLQDAAYQLMLKKRRQTVHERIAGELSSNFADRVATHPELLAHHLTEAGLTSRAIPYWREAGALSQRRWANREAIGHFRRGIELLEGEPAGRTRDATELNFRVPLGVVLMAAKGYAAAEVGECFRRARELAESLGEIEQLFHVLRGTWTWRLLRDELDVCTELALDAVNLAERPEGASFRSEAYFLPGNTAYYLGHFAESLGYLEKGYARFDLEQSKREMLLTGLNCGVTYLGQMALALWQLGFPEKALARAGEGVRLAEQLNHPFSLAFAIYHRRRVQQYARLEAEVEAGVERELELAREQKFVFREAQAMMCKGKVLIRRGKLSEASEHLERGVALYQAGSARMSLTHHFSHVADAYLDAGHLELAEQTLERAWEVMANSTERYLEAELYRLRAAVLLARPAPDVDAAEGWLRKALETARRQQARSRELRVALTWARWLVKSGRRAEAQELVRPIYAQFTEGFSMPDQLEARDLLEHV